MSDQDRSRAIAARRLALPPVHVKPGFARLSGRELEERFAGELRSKGAEVIEIEGLGDLSHAVDGVLAALGLSSSELCVSRDAVFAAVTTGERTLGAEAARAALTHAEAGVAETGTLVLASGPDNPTTLVFLPDVHLVAVSRARLYACYEDALGLCSARGGRCHVRSISSRGHRAQATLVDGSFSVRTGRATSWCSCMDPDKKNARELNTHGQGRFKWVGGRKSKS